MRALMTVDAVGGVWRYGLDLARELSANGIDCLLVGCGPGPNRTQREECRDLALQWTCLPLDWMVRDATALVEVPDTLVAIARDWRADVLHLNLPSQAVGIPDDVPVVVTSHSCLATWWRAVKTGNLPQEWCWQQELTGQGLRRANVVMVPSVSQRAATTAVYGPVARVEVVANATTALRTANERQPFVLAAGRWWDEGKNVATADAVAALSHWPVRLAGALNGPNGSSAALRHARWLGSLSPEALRAEMTRAGIFMSPALYEPFGLAVLEAAASGCALVLADIATFRELWGGAAVFVPPDDAAGFAAAINRLAHDPAERHMLSRRAAARAGDFTPARQVERVRQVYAMALAADALAA